MPFTSLCIYLAFLSLTIGMIPPIILTSKFSLAVFKFSMALLVRTGCVKSTFTPFSCFLTAFFSSALKFLEFTFNAPQIFIGLSNTSLFKELIKFANFTELNSNTDLISSLCAFGIGSPVITRTLSTPIALAPSSSPLEAFTFLSLQVICGSTSKSSSFLTLQASRQLSILALAIGLSAIVMISAPAAFIFFALSINFAIFVSIGESSSTAIGF